MIILMGWFVEYLLVIVCILVGINAGWGLVASKQLKDITKYCMGLGCVPPQVRQLSQGVAILSIMLLIVMSIGTLSGASLILELLLVYNVFHMVGLFMITYNICKFWKMEK